jgi:trimethylamine--corrinoid protein Co-methyltransferase
MEPETLKVLSDAEIEQIHRASLEVLERTGVMVQSGKLADALKHAGAEQGKKGGNIRFPASLVEKLLCKAPETLKLFSRNGKDPLEIGRGVTRSVSGFDAPFFLDQMSGKRYPITKEQVGNFAWIADRLFDVDIVGNQGIPQDVPQQEAEAHAVAALLENTGKHIIIAPDTGKAAKTIYRMLKVVSGKEDIGSSPIVSCHISPSAPLRWTPKACDIILETVNQGVPFLILPEPMAGATSPVTLAGHLVVHNAEILSGYLIAQLLKVGHPVVYCNAHTIFNMREGNPIIAAPETLLLRVAGAQMARRYKIPSHSIGFDSDSHLSDQQGSWEKALTAMVCVQAGMDLVVNLGMLSTGLAVSYAQLLLDAEVFGMLKRFRSGLEVSPGHLAVDVINKVGSWGAYLEEEHTLQFFRSENWYPSISCRKLFDHWEREGRKDSAQVAYERAMGILEAERRIYVEKKMRQELERIIASAYE